MGKKHTNKLEKSGQICLLPMSGMEGYRYLLNLPHGEVKTVSFTFIPTLD